MMSDYCEGKVHIIEEGDSLYQLSRRYNVPLALILRANPFTDVYNLQVGDEVCIPVQIGRPPEQPNGPTNNVMPEQPSQPDNDMMPEQPGRPTNNNVMPEQPSRPTNNNVMPERPSRPTNNIMPEQPSRPTNNVMPEQPSRPTNNVMPERPNRPTNNVRPDQPIQPIIPSFPTMPEIPNSNRPITLPSFPNLFSYIVEEGESLGDILDNFDVNLEDLLNFNDLDEMLLLPGSVVKVPIQKENSRN